jgi:hypothetical protein
MTHPYGEYSEGVAQALDVEVMIPGDRLPCQVVGSLLQSGWRGGQFVRFVADFQVDASNGLQSAGYLMRASEQIPGGVDNLRSEYNYTGIQPGSRLSPNTVTMVAGGGRFMFRLFETRVVTDRVAGAPLVYNHNDYLYVSERGLLTNESTALAFVGITNPILVGVVCAVPSPATDNRLGIDMKY